MTFGVLVSSLVLSVLLTSTATVEAQGVDQPPIAEALKLVESLTLDQATDAARFQQIGYDRAAEMLMAVMSYGQRPDATRADWTVMYRAITGLVQLNVARGELFRASVMASLSDLMHRNYDGDIAAALAASLQSLDLVRASGEQGEYMALFAVGQNLHALGRPAEALTYLRQAQTLHPDPLSNHAALVWRKIVEAELGTGTTDVARRVADAFATQATAASLTFRAHAELASADVDAAAGRHEAVMERVRRARDIVAGETSAEAIGIEATLRLLAIILDATRALPYAEALALARRIDETFKDVIVTPFARVAIRNRRRMSGEFDALLREDASRLDQARAAGNLTGQIEALRSLAVTHRNLNAVRQYVVLIEEALTLEKQLFENGRPANQVAARYFYDELLDLGTGHLDLREPDLAQPFFDEVIAGIGAIPEAALRRSLADKLGSAYLGSARVAEATGDRDQARTVLAAGLAGQPSGASFDRPQVLLQLARLERDLNPVVAVSHYSAAIDLVTAAKERRLELVLRLELARYLGADAPTVPDRLTRAKAELALVDTAAQSLNIADAQWRVGYVGGIVAEAAGEQASAIGHYRKAVDRLDEIRAGLSQEEARAAFVDTEAAQDLYRRLVRLLTLQGSQDEAWHFLERGKARAFLEMLQGRRFQEPAAPSDELQSLEQQIVDLRLMLSPGQELVLRGAGREPGLVAKSLRALELKFSVARQQAGVSAGRSTHPLALAPIPLADLRRRMPARVALVEYAILRDTLSAFVVTRTTASQLMWKTDTARLRSQVIELVTLLKDSSTGAAVTMLADEVGPILLEKVLAALPATTERLIIVPSEFLAYLPFEVLPAGGDQLVIDRFAVSYLPSASTLQFLAAPTTAERRSGRTFFAALGDRSVETLAALPATLDEVTGAAAVVPRSQVVTEREFTHATAVAALKTYDRVHFATHGVLNDDAPLFSALLMGGAEGSPTRLSLYEITDLVVNARLVVLSACETGLGRTFLGDEVMGLTRTFLQAGAQTVVSSLWQVADESTALLMQRFYLELERGLSPSRALRRAALAVRDHREPDPRQPRRMTRPYAHPFFWAPFIVTGVP